MSSFISSSRMSARKTAEIWLFLFSVVMGVLLALFMVMNSILASRPRAVMEMEERQLTAHKIFSPERYDMVAAGSSRINYGIDPVSMQPFLPGIHIHNCGLPGGAVNREILDYLERSKIDWGSTRQKIVLIEFSPRVMFASLRKNGNYKSMLSKSPDEIRRLLDYSPSQRFSLYNLLLPMSRERWNMRRVPDMSSIPHCHVDTGWYEVINISEDPREGIAKRLRNGEREMLHPERYEIGKSLNEILERTREWSSRGVLVFGIEPPIAPEIRRMEEQLCRYNRPEALARFRNAGGIFIPVTGEYQSTLDGSHLDSEQAKRFSAEIAEKIALHLRKGTGCTANKTAVPKS